MTIPPQGQRIPVEIANLAVDALEKRIATLEAQKAALAAEVERLRNASFVTAVPSEEYERLKAENERLRKELDTREGGSKS